MAFKVVNGKIINEETEQVINPGEDYQKVLDKLDGKKFIKFEKTTDGFRLVFDSGLSQFIGNIVKILSDDEKLSLNIFKNKLQVSLKAENNRVRGEVFVKTDDSKTVDGEVVDDKKESEKNDNNTESDNTEKDSTKKNSEEDENMKFITLDLDEENDYAKIEYKNATVTVNFDDANYWVLISVGKAKSSITKSGESVVIENPEVPVSFKLVKKRRKK